MTDIFNPAQIQTNITVFTVIINIVLALILALAVATVYRQTHRGLSYSQSFTVTLVLVAMLMTAIMMVIGNSLAVAFGAFGAFSIIRFRTAIKDTRDIAFVLIAMAIGLGVGTGNYLIAVVTTVIVLAVVIILAKINFGSIRKYDYVLNFSARSNKFSNDSLRQVFNEFLKYDNLLNVVSRDGGQILDYSFNIKFMRQSEINTFIERLNKVEGIESSDIISAKNDIEY